MKVQSQNDRFVIADDNGNIVDDAQGYGYKTFQNAQKAMWYKFKGGKKKINTLKIKIKQYYKEHPGLREFLTNIYEWNFKEIARGEYTNQDIIAAVKEKFNIDIPREYLIED